MNTVFDAAFCYTMSIVFIQLLIQFKLVHPYLCCETVDWWIENVAGRANAQREIEDRRER